MPRYTSEAPVNPMPLHPSQRTGSDHGVRRRSTYVDPAHNIQPSSEATSTASAYPPDVPPSPDLDLRVSRTLYLTNPDHTQDTPHRRSRALPLPSAPEISIHRLSHARTENSPLVILWTAFMAVNLRRALPRRHRQRQVVEAPRAVLRQLLRQLLARKALGAMSHPHKLWLRCVSRSPDTQHLLRLVRRPVRHPVSHHATCRNAL
ncbi:hypothetical protein EI94DRAFT_979879 [Lactarius quietus]|nr:hypothetical protein EI94DRAFT_979879 [Lactarius quietus]